MSRPASRSASYGAMPGDGVVTACWKYNGTISTRPPMLITIAISTPSRPTFFSTASWFMRGYLSGGLHDGRVDGRAASRDGLPDVVRHDEHATEDQRAAREAYRIVGVRLLERLDERVSQRAVG